MVTMVDSPAPEVLEKSDTARPIVPDEASGVLHPERLARYAAEWIEPDRSVREVVDQYWHVRWHLDDGERIDQPIVDLPAITLTVESGDVPAGLVATGVQRHAWRRTIHGSGEVFAVRLRPAGLAVLGSLRPHALADATTPVTRELDPRLHRFLSSLEREATPADRAAAADRMIAVTLEENRVGRAGVLANRAFDELRHRPPHVTGPSLAAHLGVSERTVQRAFAVTLGIGPKQVARRIRLQQATQALAVRGEDALADVALELGYADQAHLTTEFRRTTGLAPGAYRRELLRLMEA